MIRTKQKDYSIYFIAIAQGVLIGIVGFLLIGYLITYLDEKGAPSEMTTVPVNAAPETDKPATNSESESALDYYTVQYGVFSTEEAAQNYLKGLELPTAQIVQLDSYLFIWEGFSATAEGLSKKQEVQSFTKNVKVTTKSCPAHVQLLVEQLAQVDDQNKLLTEAELRKFKSEEMQKLQTILDSLKDKTAKSLYLLDTLLVAESCVKIELN